MGSSEVVCERVKAKRDFCLLVYLQHFWVSSTFSVLQFFQCLTIFLHSFYSPLLDHFTAFFYSSAGGYRKQTTLLNADIDVKKAWSENPTIHKAKSIVTCSSHSAKFQCRRYGLQYLDLCKDVGIQLLR